MNAHYTGWAFALGCWLVYFATDISPDFAAGATASALGVWLSRF